MISESVSNSEMPLWVKKVVMASESEALVRRRCGAPVRLGEGESGPRIQVRSWCRVPVVMSQLGCLVRNLLRCDRRETNLESPCVMQSPIPAGSEPFCRVLGVLVCGWYFSSPASQL